MKKMCPRNSRGKKAERLYRRYRRLPIKNIANCQLPIADLVERESSSQNSTSVNDDRSQYSNRQSAIGNRQWFTRESSSQNSTSVNDDRSQYSNRKTAIGNRQWFTAYQTAAGIRLR